MNLIVFTVEAKKLNYAETREFYIDKLKFAPKEGTENPLINPKYPCAAIWISATKKNRQKEESHISFFLEKNIASYCNNIKKLGVDIELVTDMCETTYVASFNDPSGNVITVHCDTIEDDFGETFEVLIAD